MIMTKATSTRAAPVAILAVAVLAVASWFGTKAWAGSAATPVAEPPTQNIRVAASDIGSHSVALGLSKSIVIDFPRDIKDVLVADPKIANAVVRSTRRAYIIGIDVGQTNVFFFDADGKQMAGFDIAVTRNLNGIRAAIRQVLPDADITVEGIGDGVVLSGTVANQSEAQQAYDIATRVVNSGTAGAAGAAGAVCALHGAAASAARINSAAHRHFAAPGRARDIFRPAGFEGRIIISVGAPLLRPSGRAGRCGARQKSSEIPGCAFIAGKCDFHEDVDLFLRDAYHEVTPTGVEETDMVLGAE